MFDSFSVYIDLPYEFKVKWLSGSNSGFHNNYCYLSGIPFVVNGISITPEKSYLNVDICKKNIYDENRRKSGVYIWVNLKNNEFYVGSSSNLSKRFSWYFSFSNLNKLLENSTSVIARALIKYGYSGFRLDILEYCEAEQLIAREQYYIDLLSPKYNILQVTGSSLGYKLSESTLAKLKGRKLSSEHLSKLREHLIKHNSSEEQRVKARARMLKINESKGMEVEVLDTVTKETAKYSSLRQAALAIGCAHKSVAQARKKFLEEGIVILVKKRFIIK